MNDFIRANIAVRIHDIKFAANYKISKIHYNNKRTYIHHPLKFQGSQLNNMGSLEQCSREIQVAWCLLVVLDWQAVRHGSHLDLPYYYCTVSQTLQIWWRKCKLKFWKNLDLILVHLNQNACKFPLHRIIYYNHNYLATLRHPHSLTKVFYFF